MDEDPELIEAALPFNLKTLETLLASDPNNRNLLLQAATGFTLYARAFIEPQADELEDEDFYAAIAMRQRATRMYLRAYGYGLRGLATNHPGISSNLSQDPASWSAQLGPDDLGLMVWTAAPLGAAIGLSGDNPQLTADIAVVGHLLKRAAALDESYGQGLLHQLLLVYETSAMDGNLEQANSHYQRALELKGGGSPSLWLTWIEKVSIPNQDRAEFDLLMAQITDYDTQLNPQGRLLEILAQRRAQWLNERVDDLIL